MNDPEYLILKKMLEKNRRLFQTQVIDFIEYIDNHLMIMERMKKSIIKFESSDFNFLAAIDTEECIDKFRKGIMIVKVNLN
ncbi:hypothetical protein AB670_00067 [Chryseobacterium sp. MOF25P]|uniref:hypothetical protein n=1 Tax=unclassified Chryseobacterium TaxID=2593645 RepID=UPI000804B487|nr:MULTISPECIES: hypothetical protein [unclassified Chryseobacterium]OBW43537.1 hypothetical protein AB670_00067 [Chryseobacterium sp. MOF25P]OBW46689.1 hypothetical protein AB671_01184 [Chryseobacterium sp. BGARF1]